MICRDCLGIGHQTHNFLICWACGGSGIAYCCDGDQVSIETETSTCPYCGKDVLSYWAPREGCVPRPEYTLVANWIYHTKCWDEQVERFPPDGLTPNTPLCIECGINYSDPPSKLCPGCEVYQEHTR